MNNNNNLTALFIDNNRHTYNIQLIRVEQTYKRMVADCFGTGIPGKNWYFFSLSKL